MALSKTGISYLTHVWNFYTGCRHYLSICPCADKCWARVMANRFGQSFEPTLHPDKLLDPLRLRKPGRIGVCFTGDLGGDWVDPNQIVSHLPLSDRVKFAMMECPQHKFFVLTKRPDNLLKWGEWPDNAWVGATVCNYEMLKNIMEYLPQIQAKNKWISFEPLIKEMGRHIPGWITANLLDANISWIVIGGWSRGSQQPKVEWIREIVEAADKAGIPVFLKENLFPLLRSSCTANDKWALSKNIGHGGMWRQELPEGK